MYKKPFIVFIIFLTQLTIAQLHSLPDTLSINVIGQQKGLLQLNVKEMALDDLGYLWAGTEDGLNRFNGYKFIPYLNIPNDSTSIKDDHIRSLLFTNDTLWIATNSNGITGFIPSKNRFFEPYITPNNKDLHTSYKILKLNKNQLLFSVKNNFVVFNRNSKKSEFIGLPKTSKENYINDLLHIDNDKFWLATSATGILELNIKKFNLNNTNILNNLNIQCLYKQEKHIFIGTNKGLFIYDLTTKQHIKTTLTSSVKCFYKLNSTQFYLGTDNGLFLYDSDKFLIIPFLLMTKENKFYKTIDINHILGDNKGNLWIGTEARGLLHHNIYQKKFSTLKLTLKEYPLIDNISSFQFLKDKDSTLWIGSKYGIVKYFHNNNQFKLYKNTDGNLIYSIIKDKNNTIWAGGFTSGLLKYDEQKNIFKKIVNTKSSLPDNDIIEIIPIDYNTLWVCTWSGGIHKFDIKEEKFEELRINGNRINRARTSLTDSKGNIWLGTDQGVYKISKSGKIQRYHKQDVINHRLSCDRIFSIKEDLDGNIWFGTSVGLTKLDVKSNNTTLYYKQEGLPNDFIYSVLIAKNNDVWVSTNSGISVLNSTNLTFKNYSVDDGLQSNEFNGKSGYKDDYGNFYFGGISGINIFKPDKVKASPFMPKIYIESVDLFNKPLQKNILFKDTLTFKSDENVITFNYSALNYLNPEKSNYSFKLEGFDDDWRPVTKDRNTTYTNLNPGKYTFKVNANNGAGIWTENPDTMNIIIIPFWYQTKLFKIISIILFLMIGPLYYFYKTRKLKKDNLKLEQIVSDRTREITLKNEYLNQVNSEVEKQNKKIQFLMRELSHRVKNNLQIISSLLNIQANSLEYQPAIDALKVARNRILAISQLENKKATGDDIIQIDSFIKELTNNIITILTDDEKLKFNIYYELSEEPVKNLNITLFGLILNELLTNTIKYAFDDYNTDNKLSIICKINDGSLILIVRDNGKGYTLNKDGSHKNIGLELVYEMVDQLKGSIKINSNNGTENTIVIPI